MVSFPRDLMVDIHCPGRGSFQGPINSAYALCGPARHGVETVKRIYRRPDPLPRDDRLPGLHPTVDKLGGVWIDIDRRYFNDNSGGGYDLPADRPQPGYQELTGRQALSFVRYRHTDSDLYRIERQRLFMRAL